VLLVPLPGRCCCTDDVLQGSGLDALARCGRDGTAGRGGARMLAWRLALVGRAGLLNDAEPCLAGLLVLASSPPRALVPPLLVPASMHAYTK
jgi:hypothetical protein